MEDKFKFVVRGRKEGNKFVLEEITNFILKNLEGFNDKTIIVTFETPVTPNEIKMNNGILINWLGKSFIEILEVSKFVIKCEDEIKLIAVLK